MMISKEESPRTTYESKSNAYIMHYKDISDNSFKGEFTSDTVCVSKKELEKILELNNYFKL